MASALRSLFGGSKATQVSSSTPQDMTPQEFQSLRPLLANIFRERTAAGPTKYTGPLSADIGTDEQAILDRLMAPGGTPDFQPQRNYFEGVVGGDYLKAGNPFLEAMIKSAQRPTLQGLEETLTRALPGRFTQAGQFVQPQGSSAFDRAAAIATRGTADAVGDIATKLSFASHDAERGRQQEAGQHLTTIDRAEMETTISNLQAQALPRLIQDMGIERGLELFKVQVQEMLQVLQLLGGVTSPTIANQSYGYGESTSEKGIIPGLVGSGGVPIPKGK